MKKVIFIFFVYFSFFGCNKRAKELDQKLYDVIMIYQNENPVPLVKEPNLKNSPGNVYNYVYEVKFDVSKDTVMSITLKPQGFSSKLDNFGIYNQGNLYPTIINDKNKSGNRFIKDYKKVGLEKFLYKGTSIVDAIYPIHLYQVHNEDLLLIEKLRGNR